MPKANVHISQGLISVSSCLLYIITSGPPAP